MKYIVLLRGINVGTGKKVDMKRIRALFTDTGFTEVSTYINSGNIFLESPEPRENVEEKVGSILRGEFTFDIPTLVKTEQEIAQIAAVIPDEWANDSEQKTDVAYLFPEIDSAEIVEELPFNRDYIDLRYAEGAVIWNLERKNYSKSRLNKIIGHRLYQLMTVRNVNTARYLAGYSPLSADS